MPIKPPCRTMNRTNRALLRSARILEESSWVFGGQRVQSRTPPSYSCRSISWFFRLYSQGLIARLFWILLLAPIDVRKYRCSIDTLLVTCHLLDHLGEHA